MKTPSPSGASPRGALLQLIRRLHFYIGLFIAPFIFVAALTGTLYVLTPQLEALIYKDALQANPAPNAKQHLLSEQIAAAQAHAGDDKSIYAVRPAPTTTETTRVQFVAPNLGASLSRAIFIDPYTLAVKGDMVVYGTSGVLPFRTWLDKLHSSLLMGNVGRLYSELAASWLWVAALSGLFLWWKTRPKKIQAIAPKKKSSNTFLQNRTRHTTIGLSIIVGLLFFSVTGLTWSQWAGGNINIMRANLDWLTPQVNAQLDSSAPTAPVDPHAEHHMPAANMEAAMSMHSHDAAHSHQHRVNPAHTDWDQVLHAAQTGGLTSPKLELRKPKSATHAWTVTEVDRSWPTHVDSVAVDPVNFTVLDHVQFAHFPLIAKLTRWGIDAHMGILFGLANQLIVAAFGLALCVLIVLGYRMWWLRRPAAGKSSPTQTIAAAWLHLTPAYKLIVLLITIALGYCLPVMGASMLVFFAIDAVRYQRSKSRI